MLNIEYIGWVALKLSGWQGPKLKKYFLKMAAMTQIFSRTFWKIDAA